MANFSNIRTSARSTLGDYTKFIPEPRSNSNGVWGKVYQGVRSALQVAGSTGINALTGGAGAINSDYQNLIETQMELQQQMMLVSMQSNLEKTQHDTRMAPVRNLRVS